MTSNILVDAARNSEICPFDESPRDQEFSISLPQRQGLRSQAVSPCLTGTNQMMQTPNASDSNPTTGDNPMPSDD